MQMDEILCMLSEFRTDYNQARFLDGFWALMRHSQPRRPPHPRWPQPCPPQTPPPPFTPLTPHPPQTHFVRNDTFKKAADGIQGPTRKIFIEFLEVSGLVRAGR